MGKPGPAGKLQISGAKKVATADVTIGKMTNLSTLRSSVELCCGSQATVDGALRLWPVRSSYG
jgi:hypothetical protein